jgi:hypothetical protein
VQQGCDTTRKQRGGITGKGFVKGDPRINRKGRPRNFDEVRALAQKLSHEKENSGMLAIERVLRSWRDSKEPQLQKAFLEYAYGKVPDKIETDLLRPKTILRLYYAHERPELQQPDLQQPDGASIAVNGEGTRRRLLPDAD